MIGSVQMVPKEEVQRCKHMLRLHYGPLKEATEGVATWSRLMGSQINGSSSLTVSREGVSPVWETLAQKAGFNAKEMAKLCGVSVRTVQRHFKRYDLCVGEWIRALRLRNAYACLLAGRTVKEAAYESGYTHLSNFSRAFKEAFGVPPRLFCDLQNDNVNEPGITVRNADMQEGSRTTLVNSLPQPAKKVTNYPTQSL